MKRKPVPHVPVPFEELREDVDWLLRAGETPEGIARRVGVGVESIKRAYQRHGLPAPEGLRQKE